MASFSRSASVKPASGVLAGPGSFILSVVGSDKTGSQYDVHCTLDTEYIHGQSATLRIQSVVNGAWFTHREVTQTVPLATFAANFNGAGRLNYTFAAVTDANRSQMRIQVTTKGYTFQTSTWNEGNM